MLKYVPPTLTRIPLLVPSWFAGTLSEYTVVSVVLNVALIVLESVLSTTMPDSDSEGSSTME